MLSVISALLNSAKPQSIDPQLAQQLTQLKGIHPPDAIGLWPLAIGWWLLIVVLPIILLSVFLFLRYQKRSSAIKDATIKLLQQNIQQDDYAQYANQTIKRFCKVYYPQALPLSGQDWAKFLRNKCQSTVLTAQQLELLSHGLYQSNLDYQHNDLASSLQKWVEVQPRQSITLKTLFSNNSSLQGEIK